MQCREEVDDCHEIRRKFYLPGSPAGRGAKWEWAGDTDDWHTYDMEVQCLIEEAWAKVKLKKIGFCSLFLILHRQWLTMSYVLILSYPLFSGR